MSGGVYNAGSVSALCNYSPVFIEQSSLVLPVPTQKRISQSRNSGNGLLHRFGNLGAGSSQLYDQVQDSVGTLVGAAPAANWITDSVRGHWVYQTTNGTDYIDVSNVDELNDTSQ